MKAVLGTIGVVLGALLVLLALTWMAQGSNFFLYKVFAHQYAVVEREVYEGTPSYNQGMIQELQNMQREYLKAPEDSKPALRKIILRRSDAYPNKDRMPADLQAFIAQLEREERSAR